MAVTVEQAAAFLAISPEEPLLPALLDAANVMVKTYLRPGGEARISTLIRDHAVKTLVSELWRRRNTDDGVLTWSPDGSTPVRLARDPMVAVKPLLDPYRAAPAVG